MSIVFAGHEVYSGFHQSIFTEYRHRQKESEQLAEYSY